MHKLYFLCDKLETWAHGLSSRLLHCLAHVSRQKFVEKNAE